MPNASRDPIPAIRLAVVEDDAELRDHVMIPALREAGFEAVGLATSLQLYRHWTTRPFDLVLLDVGLPDDDGVEIARHLRGLSPDLGIALYTGNASTEDRMRGLRAGVDAYLVKPLHMDEVVETLRNLVRRIRGTTRARGPDDGWSLDRQGWHLRLPKGGQVALNQAERQVLSVLAANAGMPVRRETLIATLTSDVDAYDPHRLETLLYRLRRKCEQAGGLPLPVRSVRGVGYMLAW